MAINSGGLITPEEIEANWPVHQMNRVQALNELENEEYLAIHDSEDEKKARGDSKRKVESLHKKLLRELEETTYADLISDIDQKSKEEQMQEEYKKHIDEHNKNVPDHLMPKLN